MNKKNRLTTAPQVRKNRSVRPRKLADTDEMTTSRATNRPPAILASDTTVNPIRCAIVRDAPFFSHAMLKPRAWLLAA